MKIEGKVAVVTGAASGIGLATATALSDKGAKVVLADVFQDRLDEAVAALKAAGRDVVGVQTDVSDFDSMQNLASKTYEAFGAAHIVHLNAGISGAASFLEGDPADWERAFGINCFGVIWGIKVFLPRMNESGKEGVILATSSGAGAEGINYIASAYAASKASVMAVMESLYGILRDSGSKIRAGIVLPPLTATRLAGEDPSILKFVEGHLQSTGVPAVLVQPEQVAAMVVDGIEKDRFWVRATRENAETVFGGAIGADFFDWNDRIVRARGESQIADEGPDSYLW